MSVSLQSLQQLDLLASGKIETLDDARAYVRKSAELCRATEPALLSNGLEARLALAELDAARDPDKLVSDEHVAEAFNLMSDEFRIEHPVRLTSEEILQYRGVMAAIFPHIFYPKNVGGSRPVGAIVMLYQLVYNGGVTDGVRKAAQLDRAPGSLKISSSGGRIVPDTNPNLVGREYQRASLTYFQGLSHRGVQLFIDRLARIMALPGRRES